MVQNAGPGSIIKRHPGSGPERATGRLVMMSSSLGFTLYLTKSPPNVSASTRRGHTESAEPRPVPGPTWDQFRTCLKTLCGFNVSSERRSSQVPSRPEKSLLSSRDVSNLRRTSGISKDVPCDITGGRGRSSLGGTDLAELVQTGCYGTDGEQVTGHQS